MSVFELKEGTLQISDFLPFTLAVTQKELDSNLLAPEDYKKYQSQISKNTSVRVASWLRGRAALKMLNQGDIHFPHRQVSLTHSGSWAVAVSAPFQNQLGIGIDLELKEFSKKRAGAFFLDDREMNWVGSIEPEIVIKQLTRLWSAKEALFKSDPKNAGRVVKQYRLKAPEALSGEAFCEGDSQNRVMFRYRSFEVDGGYLTLAASFALSRPSP